MKKFIIKIQNSDEETKKFWLFVMSGLTMGAVIALWLGYVNLTIGYAEQPVGLLSQNQNSESRIADYELRRSGPGFFTIFFAGLKTILSQVQNKIASATNNISIENPQRNFQTESVTPTPVTLLP